MKRNGRSDCSLLFFICCNGEGMLQIVRDIVWSFPLLVFLLLFGVCLLWSLRKYPILRIKWVFQQTIGQLFEKKDYKKSLRVFSVALSGTMGIGNIIGASSCVLLFGAGSLFWMWVSAIVGMIIKYAEIVIAMHFRKRIQGNYYGGPMMNMQEGLKMPNMGVVYAILCFVTSIGIGNLVPMNALVSMLDYRLDIDKSVFVIVLSVCFGFILFKGKDVIEKVCMYMVPLMSFLFIGATFVIVCLHLDGLWGVLQEVFRDVFSTSAIFGGVFWTQLQMGLARGIYSNEAGMGTSSLVHVKNENVDGCEQGAWGILEVVLDTLVSCTLSALVVLLLRSEFVNVDVYQAMYSSFQLSFGTIGDVLYFVSMLLFACSGMLAWCYYAKECMDFLKIKSWWYPYFFMILLLFGAYVSTESLWAFTDICNGFMLILNVSSMIGLYDIVINCTKKYFISKGYHVK